MVDGLPWQALLQRPFLESLDFLLLLARRNDGKRAGLSATAPGT
jgi:hypothetical protein